MKGQDKMEQGGEREEQRASSVRRLCWLTLSNETWHLACSMEGGIEREGGEEGTKEERSASQDYAVQLYRYCDNFHLSFHNHLCSAFLIDS